MKINYLCNCQHTDFNNKYSYWEEKSSTDDESEILDFLLKKSLLKNMKILHIGIGNSKLAKKFSNSNEIFGITVSKNEIENANKLLLKGYSVFLLDKYSINFMNHFKD